MARASKPRGATFADVEKIGLRFPGVEAGTSYGTPALKVGRKFMSRLREHDVVVLTPVYEDEKRFLMETQPETFFLTDHYRGYPAILIRLSTVAAPELEELIEQAWRRLATKTMTAEHESRTVTR